MENEDKLEHLQGQIDVMSEAIQSLISGASQSLSLHSQLREFVDEAQKSAEPARLSGMRAWVQKWVPPKRQGDPW